MEKINIEVVEGNSKKSGNSYKAIKLSVGEWSTLVFPRSSFEMNYIEKIIEANK